MAKDAEKRVLQIELIVPQEETAKALATLRSKIVDLGLEDSSLIEVTAATGEDNGRGKITPVDLQ